MNINFIAKLFVGATSMVTTLAVFASSYTVWSTTTNLGRIFLPADIKGSLKSASDKDVITFEPYFSGSYRVSIYPYTGPNTIYWAEMYEEGKTYPISISSYGSYYSFESGKKYQLKVSSFYCPEESEYLISIGSHVNESVWVRFDGNGGTSSSSSKYYDVGSTYMSLPTATWEGHEFSGWYTERSRGIKITSLSTVCMGYEKLYAHWVDESTPIFYKIVMFYPNGGSGNPYSQILIYGYSLPLQANKFDRDGYEFVGWAGTPDGDILFENEESVYLKEFSLDEIGAQIPLYAKWVELYNPDIMRTVMFNANGGSVSPTSCMIADGSVMGVLPVPTRNDHTFLGWFTAVEGGEEATAETVIIADVTYYAHWAEIVEPEPGPEPEPQPEPVARPYLYEAVEGAAPGLASAYDGYLYNKENGALAGTIQIKVGKPNKNTGLASVKATLQLTGQKKLTLKAVEKGKAQIVSDGSTTVSLAGGEPCEVTLGAEGLSGTYGQYAIDGARNLLASKDKSEQSAANNLLEPWLGAFAAVWDGGSVSVSIAKKGKAKATLTLADGTKATANAQLLVGEEWLCVPVVVTKKTNLAFALWLSRDGGEAVVEGLPGDAIVGRAGALKAGSKFSVSKTAALWEQIGVLTDYLPDEVPITLNKTKWMLPKAGKVAYLRGTALIDESKLGENPSGLKLSYKAKDGSFKGSFKAYAEVNGKLKAKTVSVSGVVVGGKGYGSATIKKAGSVAITIE